MPAILIALVSALAQAAGTLTGRVLLALGVQFVTFQGFDAILDQITSHVAGNVGGLPGEIAQYVGFFRLPEAISIITGAITAKWTLQGLSSGAITRMIVK